MQPRNNDLRALLACRAIILDMDGLALDTEATYCHAWRRAAADLGFELSEEFCRNLFGRHVDDVERTLAERFGQDFDFHAFHRLAEAHWREYLETHGVAKMPGLDQLLAVLDLRGLPYALATNSDAPYALECLERAGVREQFPIIVTRDQVRRGKPAPDLFLEAARRLGVPAGECLALEDSETGWLAASRAGVHPVLVPRPGAAKALTQDRPSAPSLSVIAEFLKAGNG